MHEGVVELDSVDKKILCELDADARVPVTSIASRLKLSPQVVSYRLRSLLSRGVVSSFVPLVDYKKAGYTYYTVYYSTRNLSQRMTDKIKSFLLSHPNIVTVMQTDGVWDISLGIIVHDPLGLYEVLKDISTNYGEYISAKTILTHIGARYYGREYLLGGVEREEDGNPHVTGGKLGSYSLDEEDVSLIRALKDDARASTLKLVGRMKSTVDIVRYRMKKLEKNNLIVGYTFIPGKNYPFYFYRILMGLHRMDKQREAALHSFFAQHPNVLRTISMFGVYDLAVDVEIDERAFRQFTMDFRSKFGDVIFTYDTLRVYKIAKFGFFPG
ncbi:Lrp/AsnC family transcriptional regulator [Candidatus Micrarchaeota archaeon]|nr:Lrp/AsnC family transcriptional regulator [Candidatus Micrarchaeota archaeon]